MAYSVSDTSRSLAYTLQSLSPEDRSLAVAVAYSILTAYDRDSTLAAALQPPVPVTVTEPATGEAGQ